MSRLNAHFFIYNYCIFNLHNVGIITAQNEKYQRIQGFSQSLPWVRGRFVYPPPPLPYRQYSRPPPLPHYYSHNCRLMVFFTMDRIIFVAQFERYSTFLLKVLGSVCCEIVDLRRSWNKFFFVRHINAIGNFF